MKLFNISKTFDKKQWRGFITYVNLYHKPQSAIGKIVAWLDQESLWNRGNVEELEMDELYSTLSFPIKSKSFSNSLATLGILAEEYLGWMVWKDSPNLKRSCMLTGLAQKSLTDQYIKKQKEVFKQVAKPTISVWDEFYKMQTLFTDYYFAITTSEDNYTAEFNSLVLSFKKCTATIAQFLMVEIRNREKLLRESWQHEERFFQFLYNTQTDLVHVTDKLIGMNYDGEITAYNYLKELLATDEIDRYSIHVQYSIVIYSINFLARKIKEGSVFRAQELLDLYIYSLKKGIYTLNDSMPLKKLVNIIGVASKLNKYDWARKVVDDWAHKVDEYNAKTISDFGHATIDFHQKKYDNVVDTLAQMKSSNFNYRLRSRWLLLMAQYEINKNHIEIVKIQIDNFRRFVVANEARINRSTYEGIKSSIKILNMLLNRKNISQIENLYMTSKYIFERKWIHEKIKNPV